IVRALRLGLVRQPGEPVPTANSKAQLVTHGVVPMSGEELSLLIGIGMDHELVTQILGCIPGLALLGSQHCPLVRAHQIHSLFACQLTCTLPVRGSWMR